MSSGTAYVTTYCGEFWVLLVISTSEHCLSTVVESTTDSKAVPMKVGIHFGVCKNPQAN